MKMPMSLERLSRRSRLPVWSSVGDVPLLACCTGPLRLDFHKDSLFSFKSCFQVFWLCLSGRWLGTSKLASGSELQAIVDCSG